MFCGVMGGGEEMQWLKIHNSLKCHNKQCRGGRGGCTNLQSADEGLDVFDVHLLQPSHCPILPPQQVQVYAQPLDPDKV